MRSVLRMAAMAMLVVPTAANASYYVSGFGYNGYDSGVKLGDAVDVAFNVREVDDGDERVVFYSGSSSISLPGVLLQSDDTSGVSYHYQWGSLYHGYWNFGSFNVSPDSYALEAGKRLSIAGYGFSEASETDYNLDPERTTFSRSLSYTLVDGRVFQYFLSERDDVPVDAVPELATWLMMLVGFGAMGVALRRRSAPVAVRFRVARK